MTMAIIPAQTGRISGIFWRRPALGLFLLLLRAADVVWHRLSGIAADPAVAEHLYL